LTSSRGDKSGASWWGAGIVIGAMLVLLWVANSLTALYDRLATVSPTVATVSIGLLVAILVAAIGQGVWLVWIGRRASRKRRTAKVHEDPTQAARQSVDATRQHIDQVTDEIARRALSDQLDHLAGDLAAGRFTIVVFGTTSAGKTSVINALTGVSTGETDVLVGTTRYGVERPFTLDGFSDGQLRLVDTPGLSEFGQAGMMREEEARELATTADLLLFILDQDLRDVEDRPLQSLGRLGKRCVVVLNKRDLFEPSEVDQITEALRRRLAPSFDPLTLVCCAAAPAPVTVRDASGKTHQQVPPPDVTDLAEEIAEILRHDGRELLAKNVMLQAHRVCSKARDAIQQRRRAQAGGMVTKFQWTSAAVLFVNPVPGLGALATTAINYQMIIEIGKVFGVSLDVPAAKRMASELAQILIKIGVVGLASDLLGKALKATLVGYVAGGAIEAATGAYLTRLSGEAFIDYFAHDQEWGDGGMQGAVEQHFKLAGNDAFIKAFVDEVRRRVTQKVDRE